MPENAGQGAAVTTGTTDTTAPQYVTPEQLQETLSKFAGDTKAMIGRLSKTIEDLRTTTARSGDAAADEGEDATPEVREDDRDGSAIRKKDKVADLEAQTIARLKRVQAREEAAKKREVRQALTENLAAKGLDPVAVETVADSLMLRNNGKWEFSEDSVTGAMEVRVKTEAGPVGVADVVGQFLSGPGKTFLPVRGAPRLPGSGRESDAGAVKEATVADMNRMSIKELMSGNVRMKISG